jgi:hypothetical protein
MNFEEFIREKEDPAKEIINSSEQQEVEENSFTEEEEFDSSVEIDVQKAVVESLAADKAEIEERLSQLHESENKLRVEKEILSKEVFRLQSEVINLKRSLEEALESQKKIDEFLTKELSPDNSNKVSLLERSFNIPDRFEGESRDHVIEVIREARENAEKEGRVRRAQILESVLVENEPVGKLAENRAELEKLFTDNGYILNGEVINKLDKLTIQYKSGENYLLPAEIIKRLY